MDSANQSFTLWSRKPIDPSGKTSASRVEHVYHATLFGTKDLTKIDTWMRTAFVAGYSAGNASLARTKGLILSDAEARALRVLAGEGAEGLLNDEAAAKAYIGTGPSIAAARRALAKLDEFTRALNGDAGLLQSGGKGAE